MFEIPPQLIDQLSRFGQQHVLDHWDHLNESQRGSLVSQLESIDFAQIQALFQQYQQQAGNVRDLTDLGPPNSIRLGQQNQQDKPDQQHPPTADQAYAAGERLLRQGRVGVLIVAGGQGSRLGFHHPKGMYPIGPLSNRTLFEFVVDKIGGYEKKYQTQIPLFVMTSPTVHDETIAYFKEHHFFDREDRLQFFCQSTMPAVDDKTGKLLMQSEHELFLSPNGHGGMMEAMQTAGILDTCDARQVDTLFYGQIDNPLSPTCSPTLLGYHALNNSQVTLQTIAKQSASDKTGNIVELDGRTEIIEYSEIPSKVAEQLDENGQLRLWAANIAVHVFQTSFLKTVIQSSPGLPYHFAHKSVAFMDQQRRVQSPESPNAIKFERFIFDLLPLAEKTLTVEASREDVFAPVKNAPGAKDGTPQTSRDGVSQLHRRWLQAAGCTVADDVLVEIHPNYAVDLPQIMNRDDLPGQVTEDTYLQLPPHSPSPLAEN